MPFGDSESTGRSSQYGRDPTWGHSKSTQSECIPALSILRDPVQSNRILPGGDAVDAIGSYPESRHSSRTQNPNGTYGEIEMI